VFSVSNADQVSSFRCRTLNTLTSATRLSPAARIILAGEFSALHSIKLI